MEKNDENDVQNKRNFKFGKKRDSKEIKLENKKIMSSKESVNQITSKNKCKIFTNVIYLRLRKN